MNTPLLAGICGGSASGKSGLAADLVEAAGTACLLSQDDYYRGLPDGIDAADWNFDDPSAVDLDRLRDDLLCLRAGRPVDAPRYIFSLHRRDAKPQRLHPAPLIVVEGLFLLYHPGLRDLFAFTVFVDTPPDLCLERRIARDVRERGRDEREIRCRWRTQILPAYQRYIVPFREHADRRIVPAPPGSPARAQQVKTLLDHLRLHIKSQGNGAAS